jgi:hypothetical protein
MLTPFKTIVDEKLHHNDVIWTSLTLPKVTHDPQNRITDKGWVFMCFVDGRTHFRYHETWDWTWAPSVKWIVESGKKTKEDTTQSDFRDTHLIKFTDIIALRTSAEKKDTVSENKPTDMKTAVITGAKLALANEAGDVAINVIKDMVPGIEPHLESPAARALAKLLGAFMMNHMADAAGTEHAKSIRTVTGLVTTAASMELTQTHLKRLTPALEQLIQLGTKIAKE